MGIESNQSTPEFDEFEKAGEVEVGSEIADKGEKKGGGSGKPPKEVEKPEQKTPKAPAADDDDDTGGDDEGGDDESDEDEEEEKPKKKSRKDFQIERLKREKRELQRQMREGGSSELARRLESLETRLTGENRGDTKTAGKAAPDPTDTTKYPLGHLDDRYIEDKLEWLADQKAALQADTALQRQQEIERNAETLRQQQALLTQVDDLSAKGEALYDDFQEAVVETGMRGDWDLSQPTFEACTEADNGAQILYELSQDPKEARRVARLSAFQQLKFVQERDAELGGGKKPNRKPQAGAPPKTTARGANSKTQINPATDNLDDFEKQWEREAKGQR